MDVRTRNHVTLPGPDDGPVVMLSHGFGCDQNMWRLVAPALAGAFRSSSSTTSAPALRPVGLERAALRAAAGYADDVARDLQELDLRDVVFVGHSVSAMIGVLAATGDPDRSPGWCWSRPSPRYIDDAATGAASGAPTSTSCWSRWTATTSAGRRRWRR